MLLVTVFLTDFKGTSQVVIRTTITAISLFQGLFGQLKEKRSCSSGHFLDESLQEEGFR